MANDGSGLNTAADVVGGVGSVAGLVPGWGTAIAVGANLISGLMKSGAAKKQAERAEQLRAQPVQKQPIRPEFLQKLRRDEMIALAGRPDYSQAKENIETAAAQSFRNIADVAPDPQATLTAINQALYNKNAAIQNLDASNAVARIEGMRQVGEDIGMIGEKQRELELQQREDKQFLSKAATNLENAATANKMGAADQILGGIGALGSPNIWGSYENTRRSPAYLKYLNQKGLTLDEKGNIVSAIGNMPVQGITSMNTPEIKNTITY